MNPLTNMKNVLKLSEQELHTTNKTSWHDQYRESAWVYIGGLPFHLSEGDIICIFSQYGEVVNVNLIRHKDTGKSKGFCFLCYEDQRSTDLAVDNFNGIKIIRVDHVSDYKIPKDAKKVDDVTKHLHEEGCAPGVKHVQPTASKPAVVVVPPVDIRETLADQICSDIKLPPRLPIYPIKEENVSEKESKDKKKKKKEKKRKKKKSKSRKKRKKADSSDDSSDEGDSSSEEDRHRKHKKRKSRS